MTDAGEPIEATVSIDPDHHRGELDRRLFGTFVEHLGRCVYTGIYEPGHPTADEYGFRGDVAELVDELGFTLVRYPGGNFVSGYRWEDGVGPVAQRPRRLDLAWRSIEPNTVGTDEFLGWARRRNLEPILAVNLGTRGIEAAADLVEYCNLPGGTELSDRRRSNGFADPHGVRLWCLGNEMDGPWQIGHKDAQAYGTLAAQAAHAMKLVDPSIELVVCGSSGRGMPSFGQWESTVLEHTFDLVEYVSLHAYYEYSDEDRASFLGSGTDMAGFIADVVATADAVQARGGESRRRRRPIRLAFDEWNVWYLSQFASEDQLPVQEAPRKLEQQYTALDAVVVGDLLITLINHADRVAIGCQAQLVNVIAPILTEPGGAAWRQPSFHPVAQTTRRARGRSLVTTVAAPELATARYGDVPAVTAAATYDGESGQVAVLLVNRADRPATVTLRHPALGALTPVDAVGIAAESATGDLTAVRATARGDGTTVLELPAQSWAAVTMR